MMNKKRIITTIITIVIAFSLCGGTVSAASKPVKVKSVSAKAVNTSEIDVKWSVKKGNGYRVYRAEEGSDFVLVKTYKVKKINKYIKKHNKKEVTATFKDKKLKANTQYRYKVQAFKGKKTGKFSKAAAVKTKKVSKVAIEATSTFSEITLVWGEGKHADGYEIFKKDGDSFIKIKTIKKTSFTDKGLAEETEYTYRVRAYEGKNYGAFSEKTVCTRPNVKKVNVTEAEAKSTSTIEIGWEKSEKANGYEVFQGDASGKGFSKVKTVPNENICYYTDKGLKKDTKYTYKVRAFKGDTYGPFSEVQFVKTPKTADKTLGKVENLEAFPGKNAVVLAWRDAVNATGYAVFKTTGDTFPNEPIAYVKNAEYCDTDIVSGTCAYKVMAYRNSNGGGLLGEEVTVTVQIPEEGEVSTFKNSTAEEPLPAVVSGLDASFGSYWVDLSWDKVSGAVGYRVSRDGQLLAGALKENNFRDDTITLGKTYVYSVEVVYRSFKISERVLSNPVEITIVVPNHVHQWGEVQERTIEYKTRGLACSCGYCTNDKNLAKIHLNLNGPIKQKLEQEDSYQSLDYSKKYRIASYLTSHCGWRLQLDDFTVYLTQTYRVCEICGKEEVISTGTNGNSYNGESLTGDNRVPIDNSPYGVPYGAPDDIDDDPSSLWKYLINDCKMPIDVVNRVRTECGFGPLSMN